MLQTLMLIGLGFLAACLIAFLLAPFLWRYAVHATKQHIRKTSPLTMGEIRSDRDQLRAEHALTQRKIELERDKLDLENKNLQINVAELKKRLHEISSDISSHGAEIKTKDQLLISITEERDRLKALLLSREKDVKEAQKQIQKEKHISTRSATALKEANAQLKTSDIELKKLKNSIEKKEKQYNNRQTKLAVLEGHIDRLNTCSGAIKNLNDERLDLERDTEKFLRINFNSTKDFSTEQRKLLKKVSGILSLEKSVRKQWTIASKAESGGRALFAPLKNQLDHIRASTAVTKRIIEKSSHKDTQHKGAKPASKTNQKKQAEEDLSKRIRSLQDKLSA